MFWVGMGKDVVFYCCFCQCCIVYVFQLVVGYGLVVIGDFQYLVDVYCCLWVVVGDYFYVDVGGLVGVDGVNGFWMWGIYYFGDVEENQFFLQVFMVEGGGIKVGWFIGCCYYLQFLMGEVCYFFFLVLCFEWYCVVVVYLFVVYGEDNVWCIGDQYLGIVIDVLQG